MELSTVRFPVRLGGKLCLDYTNTIEFRESERCLEFLHSYEHVLAWCWRSGLLSDEQAATLQSAAEQHPSEAETAYHAALALRDALYRIFSAEAEGEPPPATDLALLNEVLTSTPRQIEQSADRFTWTWAYSDAPASILAPVALAAAELMTSDQMTKVRQCPNCGWLFVDTSRNHSRRWCSMEICGSQMKSRRQYERRKQA